MNRFLTSDVNGNPAPAPNDEYLIYQALLGGFPEDGFVTDEFRERFSRYLTKALREADTETNYEKPDLAYEQQCQAFATALLREDSPFLENFIPFLIVLISAIIEFFKYSSMTIFSDRDKTFATTLYSFILSQQIAHLSK